MDQRDDVSTSGSCGPAGRTSSPAVHAPTFTARWEADQTVTAHEIDELLLVSSWFTRFPKELERTSAFAPSARESRTQ